MRKLLPLVLALGLLAGCGSESDTTANNTYVTELNAAQARFTAATGSIAAGIEQEDSASEDRRSMRRFQQAAGSFVSQLRAIEVPGPARPGHTDLVAAVADYTKVIRDADRTLRGSTPSRAARVAGEVQAAATTLDRRLRAATQAINEQLGAA